VTVALALLTAAVTSTTAAGEEPDPLKYAKWAALIDGGFSIALTVGWMWSARQFEPPYPEGILGVTVARVLYGTSWSVLLATEVAIARLLAGPDWGGMSRGRFKNNWLFGFDVPGRCQNSRHARCGAGLGSFGEISATVTEDPMRIRVALIGGWIQGRYDDDDRRTLIESTWVQAPVTVLGEQAIALGPFDLRVTLGPGVYWGLHNAHVHRKQDFDLDTPVHELIVLHGGIGPGVHAEAAIVFFDVVSLEADLDLAAMLLGGSNEDAPAVVHPLDAFRDSGIVLWRRASAGLTLEDTVLFPLRLSLRLWAAELSPGPLDKLHHRALAIEFTVPIELDEE
jgi:hypothetical protein